MEQACFLTQLDSNDRTALEDLMIHRTYSRGETVIEQEEESGDVFFVLSGTARVTVYSEDGKLVAYRDMHAGDVFGELSAIDRKPRSACVIAVEALRVGRLGAAKFHDLVESNPSFTWALLRHLSCQSRQMTERIFEYSTMLVRERLIAELLRLAESVDAEHGRAMVRPSPTHFDLAAKISTHREAVSREMSKLAKQRLVSKEAGCLVLHDVDRLRALALGKDDTLDNLRIRALENA